MRSEWRWIVFGFRGMIMLFVFPFMAGRWLGRTMARAVGAWVLMTRDALICCDCGAEVSLVGRWQCGWCDYVFSGFAFARCPLCRAVPSSMECQACGASVRNPLS